MKIDNLYKIADFLNEEGLSDDNLEIKIKLSDKNELNRLNDDIYYRNTERKENEITNVDEIHLKIYGTHFVFYS